MIRMLANVMGQTLFQKGLNVSSCRPAAPAVYTEVYISEDNRESCGKWFVSVCGATFWLNPECLEQTEYTDGPRISGFGCSLRGSLSCKTILYKLT